MSYQDVLPPLVPAVSIIGDTATLNLTTTESAIESQCNAKGEARTVPPSNDEVVDGGSAESVASLFGQWTNCRRCHKLTVAGGAFCAYCGIPSPNGVRRRRNSASQTCPSGLNAAGSLKASGLRLVITTSRDGSNLFMKQREPGVVASSALPARLPEIPTPLCLPPTFASLKARDGETNDLGRSYGRGYEEEEVPLRNGHDDDEDEDVSDDDCLSELSDESDCSSDSSDSESDESDCFDDEEDFDDEDIIIELEDTTHNAGEEGPRLFTSVGHGDAWSDRVMPSFLGDAVVSAANLGQVM
ncbi:hypothetical protein FOZ60_004352 [Perkinsus olseni]|uniref:Uncharacterized protein n=1 Tax=Perkinsus olseni TaxID=32597 RepID=A0A7J6NU01_PEROL|nr:hypothetical protein FOZ60_004352 [Perkinsus olseni]